MLLEWISQEFFPRIHFLFETGLVKPAQIASENDEENNCSKA
jgi:hypothetical protein